MEINVTKFADTDPHAWQREWHAERNAAVAVLVNDGIAGRFGQHRESMSRDEYDDDQMRSFFKRYYTPESARSGAHLAASPDAYVYEIVTACMKAARNDEHARLARTISAALKLLLGDAFTSVLYDIATENDINIGYDW